MLTNTKFSNEIRWSQGERLETLFEARCDAFVADGRADHLAVDGPNGAMTYAELDARANQFARHLRAEGVRPGDRIGMLLDTSAETYVALLGVLKAGAAYVPFDASFPNDRIAFINEDAGVTRLVSISAFDEKIAAIGLPAVMMDADAAAIDVRSAERMTAEERGACDEQLAYVIYTSGTTGKPKGVAIDHASICNFVRVAAEVYGYTDSDRMYQGMTIAFDFSVEELWAPLLAGATLVPGRPGAKLVADDLADYLNDNRVTALACVPTLLGTIDVDIPTLRLLIVSGEACNDALVRRWATDGRVMLNAYGPTEATVTATLTELKPGKKLTIGGPLPTYTIVILEEDKDALVAEGGMGEIAIAGIGLAAGYLNRPDLTAEKFIDDFIGLPQNPSGKIYRSGDLGRITEDGEVEFHGRIDTQVKLRGYRIELGEIESVLREFDAVADAVVHPIEVDGAPELVAFYALKPGADDLDAEAVIASFRKRLPVYMNPSYLERLEQIPMTLSDKADRKALPKPTGQRLAAGTSDYVAPSTPLEAAMAKTLAETLKIERASVADDFFQDLGANSLLMARFCATMRKKRGVASLAIRDVYQHRTIRDLVAALAARKSAGAEAETGVTKPRAPQPRPQHEASDLEYYGCAALQIASGLAMGVFSLWMLQVGYDLTFGAGLDALSLYGRLVALTAAAFVIANALPIALKWVLIGRFREETINVWSLCYFRFWFVRSMIQSAPLARFTGTPLYNVYLRLLGAKIGRRALIQTPLSAGCPDLISVGDDAVIRREAAITGYKAEAGVIYTGRVAIGDRAYVGRASVLDIDTAIENDAELAYASSLQEGQRVREGKCAHGSPARETTARYQKLDRDERAEGFDIRRFGYSAYQLVGSIGLVAPLMLIAFVSLAKGVAGLFADGETVASPLFAVAALLPISMALFAAALLIGFLVVTQLPRFYNLFVTPGESFRLYGLRYMAQGAVAGIANARFFNLYYGDSSFIVGFLKRVGWRLLGNVQSGSNFGTNQQADNPFLSEIGEGTMVSDGLSMMNAEYSSTSFRLGEVSIAANSYLGNNVLMPIGAATGENVLYATKVMVPADGAIRENCGLLGSPAFEIPRACERDAAVNREISEETREERIAEKNRHNLDTMDLFLIGVWGFGYLSLALIAAAAYGYEAFGWMSFAPLMAILPALGVAYFSILERATLNFGKLEAKTVSIYDRAFWAHERHWKFADTGLMALFAGTPMKNLVSRAMGVKVGRKVFDDGCQFTEKTLIEIGDGATLNAGATLQGHSLEEGVFKSDRIVIGAGSTIGVNAFVHYGVTMGERVRLAADSFLMKGEAPEADSVWGGNPASAIEIAATATDGEIVALPRRAAAKTEREAA